MLSVGQLYLMQSCRKSGVPEELIPNFLSRCGASEAEYRGLVERGLIESKNGRILLTKEGKQTYNREREKGRF